MSVSFVQGTGTQTTSGLVKTISKAFTSTVTAGNLIVVAIGNYNSGTITITDSINSVNYTQAATNNTAGVFSAIYYYVATAGGSSFTVTATTSNSAYPSMAIYEFSFSSGDLVTLEAHTGIASGVSNSPATGALTVTGTDLIFAAVTNGSSQTVTAGSGFTLGYSVNYASGIAEGLTIEYILNQTTSVTPTFGFSGSGSWFMTAIALKFAPPVPLISLVPVVTKWGLINITAMNPSGTTVESVTSVSGVPTFYVGGTVVPSGNVYGPIWGDSSLDSPNVAFYINNQTLNSSSVVTYTMPANCIVTALGGNLVVTSQTAVTNYFGQNEPGLGGLSNFGATPTMPIGVNLGGTGFVQYTTYCHTANLRYRMVFTGTGATFNPSDPTLPYTFMAGSSGGMTANVFNFEQSNGVEVGGNLTGTVSVSNGQSGITFSTSQTLTSANVLSFTADGTHGYYSITNPGTGTSFTISPNYAGTTNAATTATLLGQTNYPVPTGQYVISFVDQNASNPSQALVVWLVGNTNVCATGSPGNLESGPGLTTGHRSVAGDGVTVTITYANVLYKNTPNYPYGYNMNIQIKVQSPIGYFSYNNTVTDFIMVGPGDSIANVQANPLAVSNFIKNALTSPNGNGPAIIRVLEQILPAGYGNIQEVADFQKINAFSYGLYVVNSVAVTSVRTYNTTTSHKIYSNTFGFDGTDAFGPYLDLTLRPSQNGGTDNGQFLNPFPGASPCTYAALEFVCTTPHGLRTGDQVSFPVANASEPFIFPITGGLTTQQPNVSVSNGSTTITFATAPSPVLAHNQGLTFGSDSTGIAYWITNTTATIGQTVYSITPEYLGTTSSSSTCFLTASTSISNINVIVAVTGQYTFVVTCGASSAVTSGNSVQSLVGGPFNLESGYSIKPINFPGFGPYGLYANTCAQFPNCALLVPVMPFMSSSALTYMMDEICSNAAYGMEIRFELGDEHWNIPGFLTGMCTTMYGRLAYYFPPSQTVGYYTVPSSPAVLSNDQAYTLLLANVVAPAKTIAASYNKNLRISLAAGCFWSGSGVATAITSFASLWDIPIDYCMVGAYYGNPFHNVTWAQACASNGINPTTQAVVYANPGNLPCQLMLDFLRYYYKYSSAVWALFATNYATIQSNYTGTPKPLLVAYEANLNDYDPNRGTPYTAGATGSSLSHDCFYHPASADAFLACFQSMQDGSPLTPGSGLVDAAVYTFGAMWGNGATLSAAWDIYVYQGQLAGDGTTNLFTTNQGNQGSAGNNLCNDMTFTANVITGNVSVAGLQLLNWIQATGLGIDNLICTSTLTAKSKTKYAANAALACSSKLVAVGKTTHAAKASLVCTSTLTGTEKTTHRAKTVLACSSVLTATGKTTHAAKAALACTSTLVATGKTTHAAKASLVCACVLIAQGSTLHGTSAILACNSILVGNGIVLHDAQGTLACNSILVGNGIVLHKAQAALICNFIITVTGNKIGANTANAQMSCGFVLTSKAAVTHNAKIDLVCISLFGANGTTTHTTKAILTCSSLVVVTGRTTHTTLAGLVCGSALTVVGRVTHTTKATLTCSSLVVVTGVTTHNAKVVLANNSLVRVIGNTIYSSTQAAILSQSSITATGVFSKQTITTHQFCPGLFRTRRFR